MNSRRPVPRSSRAGRVLIAMLAATAILTVNVPAAEPIAHIEFERHILPLLARLGCNGGTCHGAAHGQGGFRLSLFGYDPAADYAAMSGESGDDLIDLKDPQRSRLLQKPLLQIPHGGGRRLTDGSDEHRLLLRWLEAGAPHRPGSGQVRSINVTPARLILRPPQISASLHVLVEFHDGTTEDLTTLCDLQSRDDSVALIAPDGRINAGVPGDTAIIATYQGLPASAHVLVPRDPPPVAARSITESPAAPVASLGDLGLIDRHVLGKLDELNITPSPQSSDTEFLRRVTLATIGQLPSPQEIREFVADDCPDKRSRTIERLLTHPLHAALWATRFSDLTGNGAPPLRPDDEPYDKLAQLWHNWFRDRIERNVPYSEIVDGVLCATSREGLSPLDWIEQEARQIEVVRRSTSPPRNERRTLDLFWRQTSTNEEVPAEEIAERMAAAFLGLRIECAQCHRHPFDRWTQNDYRAFTNVFTQVRFGLSPEVRAELSHLLQTSREAAASGQPARKYPPLQEVYVTSCPIDRRDAESGAVLPPTPPGGEPFAPDGDRRASFSTWLRDSKNPWFAGNFVNRVWAFYFGIGLVEPVDAFSAGNPSPHPELLRSLATDFVEQGYDLRRLERQILNSRVWQLSSETSDANRTDRHNYARAYVRVLPPEVLLDALQSAIGDTPDYGRRVAADIRAVEIPLTRTGRREIDLFLDIFDRPQRKARCDCEQPREPSLRRALFLLSDPNLLTRIRSGAACDLAASGLTDDALVDELFLRTLSRWPDDSERVAALAHLQNAANPIDGTVNLLWALVNTREFVTNH